MTDFSSDDDIAGAPPKRIGLHSAISHNYLRQLAGPELTSKNLMCPVFISANDDERTSVPSLPEVWRWGTNHVLNYLKPLIENGLQSVLLFGVADQLPKDEIGSNADSKLNPVMKAIPLIKEAFPELLVACDVCMCSYTNHGHCGIPGKGRDMIDNERSIQRIAQIAVAYAKAGCDIVAPSDMMDGRVLAIKTSLREAGLGQSVAVLAYSAKFASALYGPFRDAAKTAPKFINRDKYQLPAGSAGLAIRAVNRDVQEGCDMLMVKPGLFYLDIIRQTKELHPEIPLFVYQVSGEYSMLYFGAEKNAFHLRAGVMESLTAFRRAGADCIITYFAPKVLGWLKEEKFREYRIGGYVSC